ncbi:MAG: hypothetical protein ABI835_03805 [Chloroflexota bacterium]
MLTPSVSHVRTLTLKHNGDCNLLGVTPDQTIYAEEVYGDEGLLAQHEVRFDGSFGQSVDEAEGAPDTLQPLSLPGKVVKPKTGWHTMGLNFAGPRHRGMRTPERTADLVQPLTIEEKMTLVRRLKLDVPAPLLMGIAESYVLAESDIVRPNLYFVCRRVRLAVALPQERLDADRQPYDYETRVIYTAHFYDRTAELPSGVLFDDLTSAPLHRPMDCLLLDGHLYIADGGSGERLSAIHIWKLELPGVMSGEENLSRKIYG